MTWLPVSRINIDEKRLYVPNGTKSNVFLPHSHLEKFARCGNTRYDHASLNDLTRDSVFLFFEFVSRSILNISCGGNILNGSLLFVYSRRTSGFHFWSRKPWEDQGCLCPSFFCSLRARICQLCEGGPKNIFPFRRSLLLPRGTVHFRLGLTGPWWQSLLPWWIWLALWCQIWPSIVLSVFLVINLSLLLILNSYGKLEIILAHVDGEARADGLSLGTQPLDNAEQSIALLSGPPQFIDKDWT